MKKIVLLLILLIVLVSACKTEKPIGGETDEQGCLTPAGYSWNQEIGACVREWEIDEDQAEAAKLVIMPMSYRPITIAKVDTLKCNGCYDVYIKGADDQETRMLVRNGRIFHEDITACETDTDCVPLPVCHPSACINKEFEKGYEKPEACTLMFDNQAAYNPEDCVCENNVCENKNLEEN